MLHELRESLIKALSNLKKYYDKMGPPDWVACLATLSFSNEEKYSNKEDHSRPPFIS